jgi:signal transduction histidine kinase
MKVEQHHMPHHFTSYRQLRLVIICAVVFVLLSLAVFIAWDSYSEYQTVIKNLETQTQSYARALKEHAQRTFSETDLVLKTTVRQLEEAGGPGQLSQAEQESLLHKNAEDIPQIGSLSFIDASGQMKSISLPTITDLPDMTNRPLYRFHRENSVDELFMNPPVKSRITGKWRLLLSRRVNTPSGAFAGIVMAAINISYFEKLYLSVVTDRNGRFSLASNTGDYLVLVPSTEEVYSSGKKTAPFFRKMVETTSEHTYHNPRSNIAKEYRIVSYNRLDKYPVVAIMSFGRDLALDPWRSSTMKRALTATLMALLIILLTRMLLQQVRLLDQKVQERTSLLSLSNQFLEKEIEDRKKVEENLLEHRYKMEQMASKLSLAEDRERGRIAGELHDQVGQRLILGKIKLDELASEAPDRKSLQALMAVETLIAQSLQDIRSLTFQLRPPILSGAGLVPALQWLAEELRRDHGLTVMCDTERYDTGMRQLRYEIRATLFQATRELLLNVIKHAGVSTAHVSIQQEAHLLTICVCDKGAGFSDLQELAMSSGQGGFGLYNLKQKLEFMGGRCIVETTPGAGTSATILFPVKNDFLEV